MPNPGSLDWLTWDRGDRRRARAMNERERCALLAFRRLPADEREAVLRLLLERLRPSHDA